MLSKLCNDKMCILCSDVVTLFIQCAGGGLLAMTDQKIVNIGAKIELAGLILQLCFFAMFACIAITIHSSEKYGLSHRPGARQVCGCLYASMIFLTARNVYRAVEFAQGFDGNPVSILGTSCIVMASTSIQTSCPAECYTCAPCDSGASMIGQATCPSPRRVFSSARGMVLRL